jgi:rubredoxin
VKKYVCTVCGYIYDESVGDPGNGIAPRTKWGYLPDTWECPLCGASKNEFELQEDKKEPKQVNKNNVPMDNHDLTEFSFDELSALFSNLAKGSEKHYQFENAARFSKLAEFYIEISNSTDNKNLSDINEMAKENIDVYADAKAIAGDNADRGALRALVWGEKVTRIVSSILTRYEKHKSELLKGKNIYVCEICGFVYIGDKPPEVCPVCKVPKLKISKIQKEAI